MKYLLTLIIFVTAAAGAFGQDARIDSLREARMQQVMQMMQQGRHMGAVGNTPPRTGVGVPELPVQQEDRLIGIRRKLDLLVETDPNFAKEVEGFSVSNITLGELLRNIAKLYDVNINLRGVDGIGVTSNFTRAAITDLLYFLCKEYNLDLDVVGNIVSVFPVPPAAPAPKVIKVETGVEPGTVSYDLTGDRLADVTRLVTAVGRVNFILSPGLGDRMVSGHGRDMPTDDAVLAIAAANGMEARKNGNGIWELADASAGGGSSFRRQSAFNEDQLFVDSLGRITARIANGNVQEIIADLCETRGLSYFFVTPIDHTVPLNVAQATFETLLEVMFSGTQYSYRVEEGIWLFGTFSAETLTAVSVIPLVYRSVSKLEEVIPAQLKTGLELKTFVDQNSIIASGDGRMVERLKNFLRSVDVRVPLVTIEVMIMDVTKTLLMDAGLGIGIGTAPSVTSGQLMPGVDMTLGASAINSIINSFNGFGSINLGRVTPQFYANLKMLEENGTLQIHSTPKLSTLNGNPANLKSGEKSYYKEIQTNYWGSQTPTPSESYTWKEIEANLEVNITPFVSADGMITLEIEIEQSEFTDRIDDKDGPMGLATRSFKSIIRVQNEEMVLLGGIDRNAKTISNSGLPFIARVPVLKWIFGTSQKENRDHKLNVFIKPTLIV